MREILFRGKTVDTGEWVFGDRIEELSTNEMFICDLIHYNDETLLEDVLIEVIPETVGQFTNVVNDDEKIFEGDTCWDAHNEEWGVVEFEDGEFSCVFGNVASNLRDTVADYDTDFRGNIYDNPERLVGENDG